MPRRALVNKRPYLVLSVAAALAFYYMRASALPEIYLVPIKGCAVSFLALYASMRHSSRSARILTAALIAGAVGDMAIEFDLRAGAAAFFVFHVLALVVFLRNRGEPLEGRDSLIFILLLLATPFIAYLLPYDDRVSLPAAIYALALGAMAAGAWASNFARLRVAAGAMLFIVSHLLIIAEMGPLSGSAVPQYLVWPIYYLGMFLITVGIVTTLRKRDPELRVVQGGQH